MSIRGLATTIVFSISVLPGCGSNDTPADKKTPPPQTPFELDGAWIYLGPSDPTHILTVGNGTMTYAADAGDWSSKWTVKSYDNTLHHFQLTFVSGMGTYLPTGTSQTGSYDLNGTVLTVQSVEGLTAYPPVQDAGTCTSASDGTPVPGCRLYIKQN